MISKSTDVHVTFFDFVFPWRHSTKHHNCNCSNLETTLQYILWGAIVSVVPLIMCIMSYLDIPFCVPFKEYDSSNFDDFINLTPTLIFATIENYVTLICINGLYLYPWILTNYTLFERLEKSTLNWVAVSCFEEILAQIPHNFVWEHLLYNNHGSGVLYEWIYYAYSITDSEWNNYQNTGRDGLPWHVWTCNLFEGGSGCIILLVILFTCGNKTKRDSDDSGMNSSMNSGKNSGNNGSNNVSNNNNGDNKENGKDDKQNNNVGAIGEVDNDMVVKTFSKKMKNDSDSDTSARVSKNRRQSEHSLLFILCVLFRDAMLLRQTFSYLSDQHMDNYPLTISDPLFRNHAIIGLYLINICWIIAPLTSFIWAYCELDRRINHNNNKQ